MHIQKRVFYTISAPDSDGRVHRNVDLLSSCIPAVKIYAFLELAANILFLDEYVFRNRESD